MLAQHGSATGPCEAGGCRVRPLPRILREDSGETAACRASPMELIIRSREAELNENPRVLRGMYFGSRRTK